MDVRCSQDRLRSSRLDLRRTTRIVRCDGLVDTLVVRADGKGQVGHAGSAAGGGRIVNPMSMDFTGQPLCHALCPNMVLDRDAVVEFASNTTP